MDPEACKRRIEQAKRDGDKAEQRAAERDLREWRAKGGFG